MGCATATDVSGSGLHFQTNYIYLPNILIEYFDKVEYSILLTWLSPVFSVIEIISNLSPWLISNRVFSNSIVRSIDFFKSNNAPNFRIKSSADLLLI
ncbi:hypothetical protein DK150_490003 [Flavobacterium psychrophilum]|nr:hypothetical protein DK150_490003 [Flavobacterium psychrophilum]